MKTDVDILKELEILAEYMREILDISEDTAMLLLKSTNISDELQNVDHAYFFSNIEEFLVKVRNDLIKAGYLYIDIFSTEHIKEVIDKLGIVNSKGTLLACKARDDYIEMGKSKVVCPLCKKKPKIDIQGAFQEHVLIRCFCGYVSLYEKGI